MVAKRIKKTVITGVTKEQVEVAMSEFSQAESKIKKITADKELKIAVIREKSDTAIAELKKKMDDSFEVLQAFATENKESLFSKTKSYKSVHGVFGFRTGNPQVKPMKGFTKASVLSLVKAFLPDYIRVKEEVSDAKLLADRDKEGMEEELKKCGLSVIQEETFYVESKKENEPA